MSPAGSSRMRGDGRFTRRTRTAVAGAAAVVVLAVTWLNPGQQRGSNDSESAPPGPTESAGVPAERPPARPSGASVVQLPGLGADFRARIPAGSKQVLLVSGQDRDSSDSTLTVWSRKADGRWQTVESWPAHNGLNGWTDHHSESDLRSPIGVYTLSDAGGRRRDPGSRLPYYQDAQFTAEGTGFEGEDLDGSFDYVLAIDYNRVVGTSPLDRRRPDGTDRGGGIWLHVDHGGPTHGCVTLSEDHMVELLRILDPAAHPVIVMGDATSLAG